MKKTPVTIREMDVQPIADEDLGLLAEVQGAGESDGWICCNDSNTWQCVYIIDQDA